MYLSTMAEAAAPAAPQRRGSDIPHKERFFRYFQQEITGESRVKRIFKAKVTSDVSDLQEQMGRLGDTALVGGERTDAIEHLVASIARLGSEVNEASGYLPAYDQRTYGEVVKSRLHNVLPRKAPIADWLRITRQSKVSARSSKRRVQASVLEHASPSRRPARTLPPSL